MIADTLSDRDTKDVREDDDDALVDLERADVIVALGDPVDVFDRKELMVARELDVIDFVGSFVFDTLDVKEEVLEEVTERDSEAVLVEDNDEREDILLDGEAVADLLEDILDVPVRDDVVVRLLVEEEVAERVDVTEIEGIEVVVDVLEFTVERVLVREK